MALIIKVNLHSFKEGHTIGKEIAAIVVGTQERQENLWPEFLLTLRFIGEDN